MARYGKLPARNLYKGKVEITPAMTPQQAKSLGAFWEVLSGVAMDVRRSAKEDREEVYEKARRSISEHLGWSCTQEQASAMVWGWSPHIVVSGNGKSIRVNKQTHGRSNLRPALYMLWHFFFSPNAIMPAVAPDCFKDWKSSAMRGSFKGLSMTEGHFWLYEVVDGHIASHEGVAGTFENPKWGPVIPKEENFPFEKAFSNMIFVQSVSEDLARAVPTRKVRI